MLRVLFVLIFGLLSTACSWWYRPRLKPWRPEREGGRNCLPCLLLLFLFVGGAAAGPQDAVVCLPSHGASATVIQTGQGQTYLLGCAHAFEGANRTKPIIVDAPSPLTGQPQQVGVQLVALDPRLDLSLVRINAGPLPYVCAVAPQGWQPRGNVLSVGYDQMRRPATAKHATIVGYGGMKTYTMEIPWHGRSGGALIDMDAGALIGVVHGFESNPATRRGIYVSHQAVLSFLRGQQGGAPPMVYERREPYYPQQIMLPSNR
jgi:hypothetical protein